MYYTKSDKKGINITKRTLLFYTIMVRNKNIGQIDIDSHTSKPFSEADEELLMFICNKIATLY